MFKLKVYLFLGKYIKYFREMVESEIVKKINRKIFDYLKSYKDYNKEEITFDRPLSTATGYELKIRITHPTYTTTECIFTLVYVRPNMLEKTCDLNIHNMDKSKVLPIIDFCEHFKNMTNDVDSWILFFFEELGKLKNPA